MSQRWAVRITASAEKVIEGARWSFQLFEIRGKVVQKKFRGELPSSGVAEGLNIL